MKKILALLLALVMALGCVGAVAEETDNENIIALPSFTVAFESTVNVDAVAALLPMFGVDEATVAQMQSILPLLANSNGQLVFADNGIQLDLGLKGQNILTIAGEQTEGGFAVASDILPSYVITLANETIEAIMQQFTVQTEEAMSGVDMNALAEKLTGYFMEYAATLSNTVTPGDPELGEFTFEFADGDLTFNCRMPINVDLETIKTAALALMEQIKNDEGVASLISALGTMGIPVEISENTEVVTPEVTVYAYANVDEEGNSTGEATLVTVETTAEGQTVNVTVLVEGQSVSVFVELPEDQGTVNVYVVPSETGVAVSFEMSAAGVQCAEDIEASVGENGLVIESETYFMDMENAIATDAVTFAMGGKRTFAVQDENKTAIAVEQLMADSEGEIAGDLLADVMSNGLGALIAKVSEIMPEEVGVLMALLSGGQAAE